MLTTTLPLALFFARFVSFVYSSIRPFSCSTLLVFHFLGFPLDAMMFGDDYSDDDDDDGREKFCIYESDTLRVSRRYDGTTLL